MSELDTSDVERWIGVSLGGGNMKDPVHVNDIRRWTQAMQNPNPLFYDDAYAAQSCFGRIVAPQSFTVATSDSHGAAPSIQGRLEGSHMLFGGDEWWFDGPRIAPGDLITQERKLFDYTVKQTSFAGPTMFARGDTIYTNARGEQVAKQRCTSIRYLAAEARKRKKDGDAAEPEWSDEALAKLEAQKVEYYRTFLNLGHGRREIAVGDVLPTRPIGPHSLISFATEYRAFLMNVWGSFAHDGGPNALRQAGWLPEMDKDMEAAKIDPAQADGLYKGSSRGHVSEKHAQLIGMPRGYGYGASMGAWVLDYLTNFSGEHGEVTHSRMQYRAPALTGDVTYLTGRVTALEENTASVDVEMKNQRGEVMAKGTAEVRIA